MCVSLTSKTMSSSAISWCNIHTVLVFIVISRSYQTAPKAKRTLFFRRQDLDGRLVHNWTAVHASSRVWDCAGICFTDSDCVSAAFDAKSEECVIYNRLVVTTDTYTVLTSVTVYGVCPTGFSVMNRRCIKVVTDPLDWNAARDQCRDHNAELITLESQARINEFRKFMVANGHGSGGERYWCGGSQISDGWLWMNGMTFSSSAGIWCNGEPSHAYEQCAAIQSPAFACIFDVSCNGNYKYVCEIQY